MSEPVGIDLQLNTQDYVAGAMAAARATDQLQQQMGGLSAMSMGVQRALSAATPSRAVLGAWGAFTAAAAGNQQALSDLEAQQRVTGASANTLAGGIRQLARDFPVGQRAAQATIQTISSLGMASGGSERTVIALSRSVTQLAGATGQSAPQLAQNVVQVSRAFGNLDTKRVDALNDSLTTASRSSGASATDVLNFSKSIAPMAKQAGIGQTAVYGISSAFASMGEDGYAAANTVNKMLSDLTKSVREGSPELQTYADIAGTTADNFERLFKTNPTQALTTVTNAIANGGEQGPAMLERIGIEGVRGQRALQSVLQQGGLQSYITRAETAYGNGSTEKAADAAYGGLNDQLEKLSTNAQETAQALGSPLLSALGEFTKALNIPASAVRRVAEGAARASQASIPLPFTDRRLPIGQIGVQGLLGGGAALLALRGLFGPLSTLALGQQAATSGVVRGLFGGFRSGRFGQDAARTTAGRFGQLGAPMVAAAREDRLNTGAMGRINTRVYRFAEGAGQGYQAARDRREARFAQTLGPEGYAAYQAEREARPTTSLGSRLARNVALPFAVAGRTYSQILTDQFYQVRQSDPTRRRTSIGDLGAPGTGFAARQFGMLRDAEAGGGRDRASGVWSQTVGKAGGLGSLGGMRALGDYASGTAANLRQVRDELGGTRPALSAFRMSVGAAARVGTQTAAYGAGLTARGGMAAIRGVGSLLGPTGLGLTAATVGIGYAMSQRSQGIAQDAKYGDIDLNGALNAYRESMGAAGDGALKLADQFAKARDALAAGSGANGQATMADAYAVDDSDIAAAQKQPKVLQHYEGTAQQIASQISAMSTGPLQQSDIQSVSLDLLRQFSPAQTRNVMGALQTQQNALSRQQKADNRTTGGAAPTAATGQAPGIADMVGSMTSDRSGSQRWYSAVLGSRTLNPFGGHFGESRGRAGLRGSGADLSAAQADTMTTLFGSLGRNRDQQSDQYGQHYADRQYYSGINEAFRRAQSSGDTVVMNQLARRAGVALTGHAVDLSARDVRGAGNLTDLIAGKDRRFAGILDDYRAGGGATATAHSQMSPLARQMAGFGGDLGRFYNNTLMTPQQRASFMGPVSTSQPGVARNQSDVRARNAVQASLDAPANAGKLNAAVQTMVAAVERSGGSLTELAVQSTKAAGAIGDTTSVQYAQQKALASFTQSVLSATSGERGRGQNLASQFSIAHAQASITPTNDEQAASQQQGVQTELQLRQGVNQQLAQYVEQHRNYEIQVERSTRDFHTQQTRAEQQYNLSISRMDLQYNLQRERSTDDFHRQQSRSARDYHLSVSREERDYHTSRAREEQQFQIGQTDQLADYSKNRRREEADYQKSVARSQEDYQVSRSRSIRDFNKQMARMAEDGATAMYDPYKRIQVQSVWDAHSLVANINQQSAAIKKQSEGLDALRKAGISNATLSALGLDKAENAQQVAQLVRDIANDPSVAASIEQASGTKLNLGTALFGDPSNKELSRAKADFTTSLGDAQSDFEKQQTRAAADHKQQMTREQDDFNTTVKRQVRDYNRTRAQEQADFQKQLDDQSKDFAKANADAETDFNTTMGRMAADHQTALSQARQDYKTAASNMETDFKTAAADAKTDLANADKDLVADEGKLLKAANKILHGQQVQWSTLFSNGMQGLLKQMQDPKFKKQWESAFQGLVPSNLGGTGGAWNAGSLFGGGTSSAGSTEGTSGSWAGGVEPAWDPLASPFHSKIPVTQAYGHKSARYVKGYHTGTDYGAPIGTSAYATVGGTVKIAKTQPDWGNTVVIDVGSGRTVRYAHLSHISVKEGDEILPGALVGKTGNTGNSSGPHLHYEADINGQDVNPRNVMSWAYHPPAGERSGAAPKPGGLDPNAKGFQYTVPGQGDVRHDQRGSGAGADYAPPAAYRREHPVNVAQNQAIAVRMFSHYPGWEAAADFTALRSLWNRESGWNQYADNNHSSAYGIPQALPGSKMTSKGADWETNPATQIAWGLQYIHDRYSTPRGALAHENKAGWYAQGSIFTGAQTIGVGERGPEAVIPLDERGVSFLAASMAKVVDATSARSLLPQQQRMPVSVSHTSHAYDQRAMFTGDITVQSEDPDVMARRLAAKQRRQNLVSTGRL